MNNKKFLSFFLITFFITPLVFASDFDDLFNNPDLDDIVENTQWEIKRTCDANDALVILSALGIPELLQENIYLRTNFLNKRNPLDYPLVYSDWYHRLQNGLGFYWFYNQTDRMFFSLRQDTINAVLALGPGGFISQLNNVFNEVIELQPSLKPQLDPLQDLLTLAQEFQVQERRAGLMFNINRNYQRFNLNIKFPLMYLERNYFIGLEEQQTIEELVAALLGCPVTTVPGSGSGDSATDRAQEIFQESHLISDRFGLGDTRMEVTFPLSNLDSFNFESGFFLTLPTAFAFKTGLKGSGFTKKIDRPEFDLCLIIDAINETLPAGQLENAGMNFGIAALDTLSSMLLDTPLGNDSHLGVGGVLYTNGKLSSIISLPWAERIKMRGRLSLEYLIPKRETRFFIQNANLQAFADRNFDDPTLPENVAEDNLLFLQRQLTNRVFPHSFMATVHPGVIFRWTSRWMYEGKKWGFHIGSDFWLKSKENLTNISAPREICRELNIVNAQKSLAYQSKVTGGISYNIKKPYREWTLSLNADKTYFSQGIGKDFTLSFNIDVYF